MKLSELTDKDLYDGFRGLAPSGKAISTFHGTEVVWSFLIPVEKIQKLDILVHLSYTMFALTYGDPEKMRGVNIQCLPVGGAPFLVEPKTIDLKHEILDKLKNAIRERGASGQDNTN